MLLALAVIVTRSLAASVRESVQYVVMPVNEVKGGSLACVYVGSSLMYASKSSIRSPESLSENDSELSDVQLSSSSS